MEPKASRTYLLRSVKSLSADSLNYLIPVSGVHWVLLIGSDGLNRILSSVFRMECYSLLLGGREQNQVLSHVARTHSP